MAVEQKSKLCTPFIDFSDKFKENNENLHENIKYEISQQMQ